MEEALIRIMNVSSFQQLVRQIEISLWIQSAPVQKSRIINISSVVIITCHKDLSVLVCPEPIQIN